MDAKTYATAVALILVGVGVGYVLMGPFPETTEAMSHDDGGGQYDPPHSSQVSFLNYNESDGIQYRSFWKEGNRVSSDCIHEDYRVIFYDYDMNVIAEYDLYGFNEGTIRGNSTNKCGSGYYAWIDTELPQEPVRVGLLFYDSNIGESDHVFPAEYYLRIRTF